MDVGISYKTYRTWMQDDPLFKEAVDLIRDSIIQSLEREGYKRAMGGSDTLLMFFLRALRRDIYTERQELTGKNGTPIAVNSIDFSKIDENTLKQLASLADKLEAK